MTDNTIKNSPFGGRGATDNSIKNSPFGGRGATDNSIKNSPLGDREASINEIQDEVIEEFSAFDDWMDKYQMLIDLGSEQEALADEYKTEQNLIDGCQSRVWLQCDKEADGTLTFTAESDALIVKGIIALLIRVINHQTPKDILDADLYFIEAIGLKEHLSPTRSNGLLAMVKRIKAYALAFSMK